LLIIAHLNLKPLLDIYQSLFLFTLLSLEKPQKRILC